jgi:hypothetical protein
LPWLPEWLYFRDGLPEHRELFAQLIGQASQPPAKLLGPGPVEVTVRAKDKGSSDVVVHIVNYAGQRNSAYEEPPAIRGLRLGVKGGSGPAMSLIDRSAIEVGPLDAEGYAWLEVPDVGYFQTILLSARAA